MKYVIGNTSELEVLAATIDTALGFPKFGIDAETGEPVLPAPGQDPATVPGVSLRWAAVIPKHDDPSLGAYRYDDVTGPHLDAAGLTPVDLPDDWYPPLNLP